MGMMGIKYQKYTKKYLLILGINIHHMPKKNNSEILVDAGDKMGRTYSEILAVAGDKMGRT